MPIIELNHRLSKLEARVDRLEQNAPRNNSFSDRDDADKRPFRVEKIGFGPCNACKLYATLRNLDIASTTFSRKPKKKPLVVSTDWCPLIALCGTCWTKVIIDLRDKATPDSSGAISP